MLHLFESGRHFCLRTAIYQGYVCSESFCSTATVHSCISAAYNNHLLTQVDRGVAMRIGCIHQVYTGKIFVRRHDVQGIFSRNVHEVRESGSRTYEESLESLFFQVFYGNGLAYDAVCNELYAHLLKIFNLYIHDSVRQTEFRNTIFQYTANLV